VSARVAWLAVAPVKALALGSVEEIELREDGLDGDRRFYLVDESGRLVNNKDCGPLQQVRAAYAAAARVLTLRFPDGDEVSATVAYGEPVDTTFHRRPARARAVQGPWAERLSAVAGERVRLVAPERSGVDRGRSGAVTLLGTGSLRAIAGALGVDEVDGRRFRMNVGIDGLEPHGEDEWLGRRVRIGDALVVPMGNVGRCAVTTQDPDTGCPDLDTLKALARYREGVPTTEPLPFGVHAAVQKPGRVRVGDEVAVL
jgi:uncharacterized protein YcbX